MRSIFFDPSRAPAVAFLHRPWTIEGRENYDWPLLRNPDRASKDEDPIARGLFHTRVARIFDFVLPICVWANEITKFWMDQTAVVKSETGEPPSEKARVTTEESQQFECFYVVDNGELQNLKIYETAST
jgi:hypothetical protein